MHQKSHKFLDRPILGYFLLFLSAYLLCITVGTLDRLVGLLLPDFGISSGPGMALGALAAIWLFAYWFRPDYRDPFSARGFREGLLVLLPCLLVHFAGSAVSIFTFGSSSVLVAFLRAMAPGFGEEVQFRILGVSNYMRTLRSEKDVMPIFWLSSVFFGAFHFINLLGGADPFSTVCQVVYATGMGMILGAVYLHTANPWLVMLAHMSVDFLEFCRGDLGATGGVMTGFGLGDWITTAAAAIGAVIALKWMDRKYYPKIMEVWEKKWNKNGPVGGVQ